MGIKLAQLLFFTLSQPQPYLPSSSACMKNSRPVDHDNDHAIIVMAGMWCPGQGGGQDEAVRPKKQTPLTPF